MDLRTKLFAVCVWLFFVLSCVSAQAECVIIEGNQLGNMDAPSTDGLIAENFGDPRPSVQLLDYNIVCLAAGNTMGRFRYVSIVASYTCSGAGCTAGTQLSQFDFECVILGFTFMASWSPTFFGQMSNARTDPADGSLSTSLRTDCQFCVSPERAQSILALESDPETHCIACSLNFDCPSDGLMFCGGDLNCCNFYQNFVCVEQCSGGLQPNDENVCVNTTGGTTPNTGGTTAPNTGGTTAPNTGGTTAPNTGGTTAPDTGGSVDNASGDGGSSAKLLSIHPTAFIIIIGVVWYLLQ